VRHDGAGRANDWHLAWVKVTNTTTGALAMFKCKRWVDRRRREDPGAVGAAAALPPDAVAAAGERLDTRDRLLLGGKKAALAAAAAQQAPRVQDLRMSAELGGVVRAGEEGPGEAGPEALPGYRVVFHTSRMCGSGTRAKVGLAARPSGMPLLRASAARAPSISCIAAPMSHLQPQSLQPIPCTRPHPPGPPPLPRTHTPGSL
jgi:hypothetical protein